MRMISLREKRGQEGGPAGISMGVILAVIVFVLLVILVYYGYNAWKTGSLPGQKSTISVAAQACNAVCASNDRYGYCSQNREINLDKNDYEKYKDVLTIISTGNQANNNIKVDGRKVTATCNVLSKEAKLADWSIVSCENIEC